MNLMIYWNDWYRFERLFTTRIQSHHFHNNFCDIEVNESNDTVYKICAENKIIILK